MKTLVVLTYLYRLKARKRRDFGVVEGGLAVFHHPKPHSCECPGT
jgi:hypothetical protein